MVDISFHCELINNDNKNLAPNLQFSVGNIFQHKQERKGDSGGKDNRGRYQQKITLDPSMIYWVYAFRA